MPYKELHRKKKKKKKKKKLTFDVGKDIQSV